MASAAATDPYLGREILGHIEIRQLVGIGAMGRVYRAFQRGIDRDVAVKILHRELCSNETLVTRFHREAKVASRLAHPNVVHVLLFGQLPDGAMYIVMEYLAGMSLQSALAAAGGAMPLPRALHVAVQLCDAAGEAHAQGIVHRDLKPENVMLIHRADDPDFVKVLDFGIARLNWAEPSMATAAGLIFGTARYISPEGAQGEQVGPQGDVYSIATMVYQMLSGRTPFEAERALALLVHQIHDAPPSVKDIPRSAYVPGPVAEAIMRNLSKVPGERAADARAFGRALLESALSSGLSAQDILARPVRLSGGRGSHASAVQMPSLHATKQHTLPGDVASRLGSATPAPLEAATRGVSPTEFESPTPSLLEREGRARTEIVQPLAAAPAGETVKWTSSRGPEGLGLRPQAASPDATLDGQLGSPVSAPTPSAITGGTALAETRAPSSVETTMAGEKPVGRTPAGHIAALVILCFAVGGFAMAALASKAGWLGHRGGPARPEASQSGASVSPAELVSDEAPEPSHPTPPAESVPPLASAHSSPSSGAALGTAARAAIDVSNPRPGLGQPVDLSARVTSPTNGAGAKLDGAHFRILGPGLSAGTELPASEEAPGVFNSTFTFLQAGRFTVDFDARGAQGGVHARRFLVVSEPSSPSPRTESQSPPQPAPTGSTKWL
jgi:serine/threonine-protein kinase